MKTVTVTNEQSFLLEMINLYKFHHIVRVKCDKCNKIYNINTLLPIIISGHLTNFCQSCVSKLIKDTYPVKKDIKEKQ
jgi:hypothetical protein